jgi:predicted hydrolase (HD superfamily)
MNTCWARMVRQRHPSRPVGRHLAGEARRHAKWRELGEDEETAAVAGLRALAGGRAG